MVKLLYFRTGSANDRENRLLARRVSIWNEPKLAFALAQLQQLRLDAANVLLKRRHFLANGRFPAGDGFDFVEDALDLGLEISEAQGPVTRLDR
jgi:hypothetical protein